MSTQELEQIWREIMTDVNAGKTPSWKELSEDEPLPWGEILTFIKSTFDLILENSSPELDPETYLEQCCDLSFCSDVM